MASVTSATLQSTRMLSSSSFSQVLQSDSVRRLFNQPNIVIHAIPRNNSPTAFRMIKPKSSIDKTNIINGEYQLPNKPDISIQVISMPNSSEVENLLPSKNNGKSEILLVPIIRKRKECGHFEPCESLVCNITVQEYEDDEGITPLISINIEENQIDATITKHCENNQCDALSIDHDHCRRASIQLYHCDKCIMCDICEVTFKTRKARLNHKKCRRKEVYQHNTASPSSIFKFRMRERELQILEAARAKRSCDYLDPIFGFNRTMESLTKNDELIIIPKTPPSQFKALKQSFTSINSNPNNNSNSKNINNNINNNPNNNNPNSYNNINHNINIVINNNNNNKNNYNNNSTNLKSILGNKKIQTPCTDRELTSEMISNIILSCQNSISSNQNEKHSSLPSKHIKLSDHFNGGTVNVIDTQSSHNHQYICMASLSSNNDNSASIAQQHPQATTNPGSLLNNINMNSEQQTVEKITESPAINITDSIEELNINKRMMSIESYPFKEMSIAELKSESTLPHQTHGVPKFCVVADISAIPKLVPKVKRPYQKENNKQKEKHSLPSALPKLMPKTVLNSSKFHPLQSALSGTTHNIDVKLDGALITKKQKTRKRSRKKLLKKGRFRCTHCSKRFSSVDCCRMHIAKHENNPGFFCRLCEKGFINKYVMKKHFDTDHRVGEVRCEMCNSVLSSLKDLFRHMKYPETKVKQQCSECSESFDVCSNLDIHMRKKHGFFICSLCKRQVTKTKMKRHLMLEHSISRNRIETGFDKLSYLPGENEKVCEINFISQVVHKAESSVKTELAGENEVKVDCIARSRSVRRRSSKEFFVCSVCDRRFENEKQFQIHLANNPMKFTLCPDCGRKFHRKSEYTEHSKTCSQNIKIIVEQAPKRKKSNLLNVEFISKNDDIRFKNNINQKLNATQKPSICKKLKLNQEKITQKDEKEDKNILKSTVTEVKIVNVLKKDSSDCLETKVIKLENNIKKNENYEVIKQDNTEVLLLNVKQTQINANKSAVLDKLITMTHIIQDHNYQALQ